MMSIVDFIKGLFKQSKNEDKELKKENKEQIYENKEEPVKEEIEIISIWDVINTQDHTQASHLVSVIPYDEWISMDEIMRRIWDIFQVEYKNDRSLYPYLKTMVDLGLIETSNIGGKRKWRKKDLLIKKTQKKKLKEQIEEEITIKQTN
jgi:hypothetical protein